MSLAGRSLISIDDLSTTNIEDIFIRARHLRGLDHVGELRDIRLKTLRDKVLACLFYEPSTRTSSSFIAAMARLGGTVIPITQGVQYSSVSKGETLEDTIQTLGQYADGIVLRHPEEGAAKRAAAVSPVPIINAGDGAGEHPTQALLDLFTIVDLKAPVKGKTIALVGDLLYGRTIHSLVKLLRTRGVKLLLVSPRSLRLPENLRETLPDAEEMDSVEEALPRVDVLYMTRIQKERFPTVADYEQVKDTCILTRTMMEHAKSDMIIMHPLPRVNEIDRTLDNDPRSKWFQQVRNGMHVRMGILSLMLEASDGVAKSYEDRRAWD